MTIYVTWNGEKGVPLTRVSHDCGVSNKLIATRLREGWTLERATSTPTNTHQDGPIQIMHEADVISVREYAALTGIPVPSVYRKVREGKVEAYISISVARDAQLTDAQYYAENLTKSLRKQGFSDVEIKNEVGRRTCL